MCSNVVEVYDVGLHEDVPFLVMEFLDGEDLSARIVREQTIPLPELVDLLLPVCAGVSAAHEEGVVHRDLKPENIFLARTREGAIAPRVLDFGISRIVNDTSGRVHTAPFVALGTPEYMSPEQARGERVIDDRSDQYALGVMLYECATGRHPMMIGGAVDDVLSRVVAGRFPRPRAVRRDLDPGFEAIVLRAMALSPSDRFSSVRAMAVALLPYASDRARTLWRDTFAARGANDSRRAVCTLDVIANDPRFLVAARTGPNDTMLDEPEREDTTLPLPTREKFRPWAMGAGAGVAVVAVVALLVWVFR